MVDTELKISTKGLSSAEASERLLKYGRNVIERKKKVNPWKLLLSQFSSPLIIILILAAVLSLILGRISPEEGNISDAILIMMIVVLSGVVGFLQDYKAEKTIEKLQNMATPKVTVLRDGEKREIASDLIVPEDIIFIESGDVVPADCNLLESHNLEVDESILTGESVAIKKKAEQEIYMNTYVTGGNGVAKVNQTGMQTSLGKVASTLQDLTEEPSIFQVEMASFGKKVSIITVVLAVVIAIIGMFRYSFYDSLLIAISLAVAAIPEGLPAVIVLALAVGAKKMFKKNALIRKLSTVESIGAVDVICTDKTGTITVNEMTIVKVFCDDQMTEKNKFPVKLESGNTLFMLFMCSEFCNNSSIGFDKEGNQKYLGEQTEIALKKLADKYFSASDASKYHRTHEIPFSSDRKMMSVAVMGVNTDNGYVFAKGAPEMLIKRCSRIYMNGRVEELTEVHRNQIVLQNDGFASEALRVLGFAFKLCKSNEKVIESEFIWIGLQAMIDPPRPEAKQAIEECKSAGIRVIMITGDNPNTALAIGNQVGLESNGVIEGKELEYLNDIEIQKKLDNGINIFARTSPFDKLRILQILQKKSRVAMTGDGVNDSLAIKKAHVGIAMGKRGTEVSKEASHIILLDDNFSTIKDAIKEGRTIFENVRKFINYLFTCNIAEVGVVFGITLFFSLNEPVLFPVQILWINLLTDGLVALALGVDPPAGDIMKRKPRKLDEPIINKRLAWLISLIGAKKVIELMFLFYFFLPYGIETARSVMFTGFILSEFIRIASIRYQEELGWFANKWLVVALAGSLILQIVIIYSPLNTFFHTLPLGWYEWRILLTVVGIGFIPAILITKGVMKWVKE